MKQSLMLLIILFTFFETTFGQKANEELKITNLKGDFYIFTTYKMFGTKKQSANGMYLVTDEGVILFDSPWDTSPFQPLLDSIKDKHNKNVIMCIATHSHEDRTSGLDYYKKLDIKTFTTTLTDSISKENERPRAEFLMKNDTVFNIGKYKFQTYYGGAGHTKDNIVIWFDNEKILYAGCLIKSIDAINLEYVAEANIDEWEKTIKKIQRKFKKPKFIIPGHHEWSSTRTLKHTLKLIKEHKEKTTTSSI
jgi:metallo-beta-lactamase class B